MVTKEDTCPDSHPDLVLSRPFLGTDVGCDCFGIWDRWIYDGGDTFTKGLGCGRNETRVGCRQADAIQPIFMAQLNGERVCGKRADYHFVSAVRPKDA